MIEKMKYLNIIGSKNDIDRVVDTYLNKHEIHLEDTLAELGDSQDVKAFCETNPYKDVLTKAQNLCDSMDKKTISTGHRELSVEEASAIILAAHDEINKINEQRQHINEEQKRLSALINQIEPFRQLDFDLAKIQHFNFVKFRFGRISPDYYNDFTHVIYNNRDTFFYECQRTPDYVWGVYFTTETMADEVDSIYSGLHFEHIDLAEGFSGPPEEIYQSLSKEMEGVRTQSKELQLEIQTLLNEQGGILLAAANTIQQISDNFDIRKMAACTSDPNMFQTFYILSGWMSDEDTSQFIKEISNDPKIYCVKQNAVEKGSTRPPTKLKNPKFFKPFEMFIRMYGVPAYNEMDPTIFVALTYTLMFGVMFGDVGQGLCLVVGGFLLYRFKRMNLAAIISLAGIWSTIFGFMYGSVFGFEEVLHAVWRRPMEDIMTTLIYSAVFGAVLILIAMILNMINAVRARDIGRLLFDSSGIAGFIVYGSIAGCAGLYFLGYKLPATIILVILFGIPLLCIMLKEPLSNLIEKNREIIPEGGIAMFLVAALVELFDVILSYATNTISFLRVGAFALSHAGMMGVVLSLAGVANGDGNLIVIILGNIVVTGIEGLVVGIQVLRLEYYEMFSRFYKGTGREFRPFKTVQK